MAALVAVALHSGLVWFALTLRANDAEAAAGALETAILIDLSPPEPPAPAASAEPEPSEAVSPDPDSIRTARSRLARSRVAQA